jgi:hypothetical protein
MEFTTDQVTLRSTNRGDVPCGNTDESCLFRIPAVLKAWNLTARPGKGCNARRPKISRPNTPSGVSSVSWIAVAGLLLFSFLSLASADCIVTVAGPPLVHGGPADKMPLFAPFAVSPDETGGFYIADYNSNLVSHVFSNGSMVTVAGNGDWDFNGDGTAATQASLQPAAVLSDGAGAFTSPMHTMHVFGV